MRIHLNTFCSDRQTADSPLTHWEISNTRLVELATAELEAGRTKAGYRDGVVLVGVDPAGFKTGIVELADGDQLVGEYKARREGETPRISVYVAGDKGKQPAKRVDVVLYSNTVLAEDGDNETDADYEIISVNGLPTLKEAPISPNVLMHNHFGSEGGTATNMTAEQFEAALRHSFAYWQNKAMMQ